MEFDQALKVVEEVLFTQQNRHLSDPEMTILQGTWLGMTYDEMALNSQYSVNYLMRDVGPNFWRSLSDLLGEKVSKSNCRTVLERYHLGTKQDRDPAIASLEHKHSRVIPHSPQGQNWGEAPDISTFYGRLRELETLEHWVITEQSRMVCIWGMGGMGKTTLSRQFVENVKDRFDYLFWRSLRNMPPLFELLAEMLSLFSPRETLQDQSDRGISQIVECLHQYRCLVIFDDVETILQSGDPLSHYALGYETYGQFFKRVGETQHQSCLLLNSQEKLRDMILLENSTKFVHSLELLGLTIEEAGELFKDKKLTGEKKWQDFVDLYQGNPLALNLTLITIQNFFNGDVSQYIKLKTTYLPTEIANILQKRFDQLSNLESEVLHYLAKTSHSLALLEIQKNLSSPLEISDTIAAIESLKARSLIEIKTHENATSFTVQPVVRKYIKKYYLEA